MILTCSACGAKFNLDEALLPPSGRKVRCSKCGFVWLAVQPSLPDAGFAGRPIPEAIRPAPVEAAVKEPSARSARKVVAAPDVARGSHCGFWHALVTLLALLVAFAAILYCLRDQVVKVFPPAEDLYQRIGVPVGPAWKGLAIINVSANAVPDAVGASVTVSGEVVNRSGHAVKRPHLIGTLSGGDSPVAFTIAMQPGTMRPGAHEVFSRTLSGVPDAASRVDMRFAP